MEANGNHVSASVHGRKASEWSFFAKFAENLAQVPICGGCADRIRAEAMARKRREDKGLE